MIFEKPFQELKLIAHVSLVLILSTYIHQGFALESLYESIVYTLIVPILMTHHLITSYSFSNAHIKFYGLRTTRVYLQTWGYVLYKSFLDVIIWMLCSDILFQQYVSLSNISLDIIYDLFYVYAMCIMVLSVSSHVLTSYIIVIALSFRSYAPLHLFNMRIPYTLNTIEEVLIIWIAVILMWTTKMVYLRMCAHTS